jgi:class 3 adenylate cyclase
MSATDSAPTQPPARPGKRGGDRRRHVPRVDSAVVLRRRLMRWVGIPVLAAAVAIGVWRAGWVDAAEDIYYDYWHVIAGVRYVPQHVAVVTMDDETLDALKDDPLAFWAPHFGRAMDVLSQAGAKAVGLDFLYQVSAEEWMKKLKLPDNQVSRNYDAPFRAALARGDKVLITTLVEVNNELRLLVPPQDHLVLLPHGINDLGVDNLPPDSDKYVRHFYPVLLSDPAQPGMSFAMQLALRGAGLDPAAPGWTVGGVKLTRALEKRSIGYAGPPGTVPTVSMNVLLAADALSNPKVQALRGKIVILSASNAGSSDRHFTPYSRGTDADQMDGGEIHANIIETILTGRYPWTLPLWANALFVLAVVWIGTAFFLWLSPERGVLVGLFIAVDLPIPAFFAFQHDLVLPVAEPQVGLAVAFLLTVILRLTGEERERARTRQMFGSYVSDEVVDMLLTEGRKLDLGGETVEVTVLFSDIRNFTTISERLQAHEVVEMLNEYFTRVTAPILAERGNVNKYIGDAVMAVFGSPVTYPDHARRALRAGLQMAAEAEKFRGWMEQRFPERGLPRFGVGIGIHTGDAVMGNIGSVKRLEFTAIGDTVNAASRLEGVTKELGCVLVASKQTVQAAGAGVGTGKTETVKVKGREEPIEVFEILSLDERRSGRDRRTGKPA